MGSQNDQIIMEEVTDSSVLRDARLRRARFDRNYAWFQAHVAGEMLFVADTPQAAINQGRMAHPDDSGWFVHYIPKDRVARIYAYQW